MRNFKFNVPFMIIRVLFLLIPAFLLYSVFTPKINQYFCQHDFGKVYPAPPPIQKFDWHDTGVITLWFDDAKLSQYNGGNVKLMEKYGMVGALAVPTSFVCTKDFMSWDQIRALQNKGWEITSHSVSHICNPSAYDLKTSIHELTKSKEDLESRGLRADNYVQPCGYKIDLVPDVIYVEEKNYRSYRGAGDQVNPLPVPPPYQLKSYGVVNTTTEDDLRRWISKAKREKGWLIIVFHNIDNNNRIYDYPLDKFEKLLKVIKESGLPVVLPTQALDIKKERSERKSHRKLEHD